MSIRKECLHIRDCAARAKAAIMSDGFIEISSKPRSRKAKRGNASWQPHCHSSYRVSLKAAVPHWHRNFPTRRGGRWRHLCRHDLRRHCLTCPAAAILGGKPGITVTVLDCTPEVRHDNFSDRHFEDDLRQDENRTVGFRRPTR